MRGGFHAKQKDVTDMQMSEEFKTYLGKSFPGTPPAEALARVNPETLASIMRAFDARENFGAWDECDPIANAIVALTAAQNTLTVAIDENVFDRPDIDNAAVARVGKIIGLVDALTAAVESKICGTYEISRPTLIELTDKLVTAAERLNTVAVERK
jgi:hypothetical protein